MKYWQANKVWLFVVALLFVTSLGADKPPATGVEGWEEMDSFIGAHGSMADEVYTYRLPRKDLNVSIEGMDVPTAAGIESVIHFFKCHCGKMRVTGEFCCADYEANDVIDAIRAGAAMDVASVGPMFVGDKPHLTIVRFQGEGNEEILTGAVKGALRWMGAGRTTKQPPG